MSYKNILIYYIRYVTFKGLQYVKINNGNLLYLIISKINRYYGKINENKYLRLVLNNERKEIKKI